jgi:hypothetical protein
MLPDNMVNLTAPRTKRLPMFTKLLCATKGHLINRHRVWHDSVDYRTRCDRCDQEMVRDAAGWQVFDRDDHAAERLPHPRERSHG